MSLIVCKFGGSSVCDGEMMLRVRDILLACPDRRYAVLSAPGKRTPSDEKVTDLLYRACSAGDAGRQYIFSRIFQRYAAIRDQLIPDFPLEAEFEGIMGSLSLGTDYCASRGEYLCAKLFAAFMGWPFVDAQELFFFDGNGRIDASRTRRSMRKRLCGLERAVIPGFYGAGPDGGVRSFSRGGSDVSGALLAEALDAQVYENWTDVDGLYTADPNLVPSARRHGRISLSQMERIAAAGAQLLHPDALLPLRGSGIDTLIRNTHAPDAPATRITEDFTETLPCVTGRRGLYMAVDGQIGELPLRGARKIAVVSAFALPDHCLPDLRKQLQPIDIIHMQDHKQIIIEDEKYAEAVRKIHSMLTENAFS